MGRSPERNYFLSPNVLVLEMIARRRTIPLVVGLLLAACVPAATTATAGMSTVGPDGRPGSTPRPTAPLFPPSPSAGLSPTQLKYRLLAQFPDLFFCDPDYYPVARADEAVLALQRFPEIQANAEEFQAILQYLGLSGTTAFSDEQKLAIYRQHKRLAAIELVPFGDGYRFRLRTADQTGRGFVFSGSLGADGEVKIESKQPGIATCPICLAAQTRIDTPNGPVNVEDLRVGDIVWTMDSSGRRSAAALLGVVRRPARAGQEVVHLLLSDGREIWASPFHPTADGRTLGSLRAGDGLDGARVVRMEYAPYMQAFTYDVLPSGSSGLYWANGILLASTLAVR